MRNKKFLNGVIILAVAGMISKFIGAFFKIPLTNLIGAKGLALYNYPYYLYTAMLAMSVSGLPVAMSKLISERVANKEFNKVNKILKVAIVLMGIVGVLTSIILGISAKKITNMFWPKEAYYPLVGLILAPLFVALMSVFRGYFQGMQLMVPTAISQVCEALGRLVVGLSLAYFFIDKGIGHAAGGASFGATAGSFFSLVVLLVFYFTYKKRFNHMQVKSNESILYIIKSILYISIPISIGAVASTIMSLIDSLIIHPRLLMAGYTVEQSSLLYGYLGIAYTLINFPLSISMGIAASMVPAISYAKAKNNILEVRGRLIEGLNMGVYIGLPATMGLIILSKPIINLIFPSVNGGWHILKLLAVAMFFIILNQIFTGGLQGLGKVMIPVKNLFIGAMLKISISYTLIATSYFNIKGAVIGTIVGYGVTTGLNFLAVKKYSMLKINIIDTIVKPLIGLSIMVVSVILSYKYGPLILGNKLSTIISILIGVLVYGMALIIMGVIDIKGKKFF